VSATSTSAARCRRALHKHTTHRTKAHSTGTHSAGTHSRCTQREHGKRMRAYVTTQAWTAGTPIGGPGIVFLLFAHFLLVLSLAHCYEILINSVVPGVDLITSSGWPKLFDCLYSISINSLRHQANTPVPDLPFPLPGAPSTPSLLILCMPILSACMY
jgi:hypothetical protein